MNLSNAKQMILSVETQNSNPLKVKDYYGEYLRTINVYCLYELKPKFIKAKI